MKNKKSQRAMDFLMAYGWSILAAIIVIGILASFGVFTPDKNVGFLSKECLAKEMCKDYNIEYSHSIEDKIWCKVPTSKGDYGILEFEVDYDKLEERYPICVGEEE